MGVLSPGRGVVLELSLLVEVRLGEGMAKTALLGGGLTPLEMEGEEVGLIQVSRPLEDWGGQLGVVGTVGDSQGPGGEGGGQVVVVGG